MRPYAHNNCFEAWCPRNRYIGNKANHGSYGFWLGASDETVLIGNEASYNGLPSGHHNSPHLPDATHSGIVFMFGPSSHTIVRGNTCVGQPWGRHRPDRRYGVGRPQVACFPLDHRSEHLSRQSLGHLPAVCRLD